MVRYSSWFCHNSGLNINMPPLLCEVKRVTLIQQRAAFGAAWQRQMLPHISDDLSSGFIEKLEEMLQKYRGETVNFDSKKVRKLKGFEFPRPDLNLSR